MTLPNLLAKQSLAEEYRCYFPITERYVYLNHASVSPLSSLARDRMAELLDGVVRHGARKAEEWDRMQSATRSAAARLVNAEARQIAFLRNTSEALSIVANGLDWRPGDNIVSTAWSFPRTSIPGRASPPRKKSKSASNRKWMAASTSSTCSRCLMNARASSP